MRTTTRMQHRPIAGLGAWRRGKPHRNHTAYPRRSKERVGPIVAMNPFAGMDASATFVDGIFMYVNFLPDVLHRSLCL